MNEKSVIGIIVLIIGLFGLAVFFPMYSRGYGGWGCPMWGGPGWGVGGMMGGYWMEGPAAIFLFDLAFLAIIAIGGYLIWKSTQPTEDRK